MCLSSASRVTAASQTRSLLQCCFCGGAAYGTTRLATSAVPLLLRGFWPLSSHGQAAKGVGVSPAVISASPRRTSGLAFLYEQVSYFLFATATYYQHATLVKGMMPLLEVATIDIPTYSFLCPHSLTLLMTIPIEAQ